MAIRLNRYLSESGYCSRREADGIIAAGTVTVNGVLGEFNSRVTPKDTVAVDGERVMPRRAVDFTPKEAPKPRRPRKVVAVEKFEEKVPAWKKDRKKTFSKDEKEQERKSPVARTQAVAKPKPKPKPKPSVNSKKYTPKKKFNI